MPTRTFQGHAGVLLAAEHRGEAGAPQVLLLHGGGQTRHSWRGGLDALADAGFEAFSLDLRGHGDSGWAKDGAYTLDAHAADLRAVVSVLDRPALVGASLGGLISLLAMGEAPTVEASALVLVDVVPKIEAQGASEIHAFMKARPDGFDSADEAADAVAAYLPHRSRPSNPAGLMKNLRARDGRLHWHWDPRILRQQWSDPDAVRRRLEDAARRVQAPTLLIRGALSRVVSLEGVRAFLELIPSARYVDVAEADHMVAGDRNDAFNAPLLDFLQRHVRQDVRQGEPVR